LEEIKSPITNSNVRVKIVKNRTHDHLIKELKSVKDFSGSCGRAFNLLVELYAMLKGLQLA
jgi:hypothetical protein